MQIIEVKNNLVKASYDNSAETPILSGYAVIKSSNQSFIAQILHLEATSKGNFIILKLLFNFNKDGVIINYDGSIPDLASPAEIVPTKELLEILPVQNPILLGDLAQQKTLLTLDRKLLEENLLVCSEKQDDNNLLIKNLSTQLINSGKKVLLFNLGTNDFTHLENIASFISAGEDFKLPLNNSSINFIYEKGLDDAKAETKALIQDIFLEVQEYVKTLPEGYLPFETFKNVVDSQYEETGLVELVLLKNKLLKFYEDGIFAQEKREFESLKNSLASAKPTVLDLSQMEERVQREMVSYAYSLLSQINQDFYVFFSINDSNSDKKLLKQIFTTKNAYSTLICPYSFKYLKELKQISKDLILFAPIQQQNDFAGYNAFMNKLNPHEFIIYGQATHHLSLIVKLGELPEQTPQEFSPINTVTAEETLLEEQIKQDVDKIYTAPKGEQLQAAPQEQEISKDFDLSTEIAEDNLMEEDLTEDDLDFLDDFNYSQTKEVIESENPSLEDELIDINEVEEGLQESEVETAIENEESFEIVEESEEPAATIEENEEKKEEPEPPSIDILPINMSSSPVIPIYSADVEPKAASDNLIQGDVVMHQKYGKGTVEKLITYGSKTLCSINFDNVGRRLLDPSLAEIKKV